MCYGLQSALLPRGADEKRRMLLILYGAFVFVLVFLQVVGDSLLGAFAITPLVYYFMYIW